ncbi:hypothetical protein R6Q57_018597, partial [Mikania cordata]
CFQKKLDAERRDISKLKELLSDKESNYRDSRRWIVEISSVLEQDKTELSKTKIRVDKYDYAREGNIIGLGYTEVKLLFNHNYSIMPKINKSVDELLLKSDRRFEFTNGSSKLASLTADHVLTDLNSSDNPE